MSHGAWASCVGRWRKCEGRLALHDSANAVIHCEAKWQRWLERQEERYRSDTSRADFFILGGGGNPTSVGLKLVNCSRTLKTNSGKGPFDKGTCPF